MNQSDLLQAAGIMNHVACEMYLYTRGTVRRACRHCRDAPLMKVEPADFIAFRPPPLSNLSLLSFDPLLLSLWEYSILFFHFSFPCPVRLDVVLLAPSNSLERRRGGREKEERGKKSGNEKKQRIKVYKYTAEERFAKQTVPTLVGREGARDAEFPKGRQRSLRERPLYPIN